MDLSRRANMRFLIAFDVSGRVVHQGIYEALDAGAALRDAATDAEQHHSVTPLICHISITPLDANAISASSE